MPKQVEFEGKSYDFPDDATDDEIFSFLDSSPPAQESAKTGADGRFVSSGLHRIGENLNPMPALRAVGGALTDPSGIVGGVGNLALGAAKGVLSPLRGLPDAVRSIGRGEFGKGASQALESVPVIGPISKRAGDLERAGDTAGGFGSLAGDMATLGLTELGGAGLRGLAKIPARAMTGGDTAVATAALENRALPGLIRSGPSRADIRLHRVESDISRGLEGPKGQATLSAQDMRRGPATDAEWNRIKAIRSRGQIETSARELQANAPTDVVSSAAQDVFDRARQSRASGANGMAAALDTTQIDAVGRAVPSLRPMTSRANDIQSVRDAYRGNGGQSAISPAGVPTLQGKMIVSTLNRAAGPVTQGLFNVGKGLSSDAVRAAVLAQLLGMEPESMQPMASHSVRK